jgi:hypothetical protein
MGTLFALFVVFIAAQVWNDNDRATAAVTQEASALRAVVILATTFPGESRSLLETLIHSHIEEAVTKEWPMMARQTATLEIAPAQPGRSVTAYARSDAQQSRPGDRTA